MLSPCEPLRKCTEIGFEVRLERKVWRCVSRVVSDCFDTLRARSMSSIRHGACRCYPCVRCTISSENMAHGRERLSRLLRATAERRRHAQSMEKISETVRDQVERHGRGPELVEILRLLSHHSLAEWPSFPEEFSD